MIYYLITAGHAYTVDAFLEDWAPRLRSRMTLLFYEQLEHISGLDSGTYIFADLERLNLSESAIAGKLWYRLSEAGCRLLNHPSHSARRFQLLRTLRASGHNAFQVHRASELDGGVRFPVYLRAERSHAVIGGLLHTAAELKTAIAETEERGVPVDEILVTEFFDTSDHEGLFRKYSANVVGTEVIPHHLLLSREWVVRDETSLLNDAKLHEEEEYLRRNPHRHWIQGVFQAANITYGRIDYTLLNGRPQVWEINTNPVLIYPRDGYRESEFSLRRIPTREEFARKLASAIESLDTESQGAGITKRAVCLKGRP